MQLTRGVREIRQVPRVLRKDYSSQRWWDGQTPAPKIDHTVSAVSDLKVALFRLFGRL